MCSFQLVGRGKPAPGSWPRTFAAPSGCSGACGNHPRGWFTLGANGPSIARAWRPYGAPPKEIMRRGNASSRQVPEICARIPTVADEPAVSVSPALKPWAPFYGFLRSRSLDVGAHLLSREVCVSPPPGAGRLVSAGDLHTATVHFGSGPARDVTQTCMTRTSGGNRSAGISGGFPGGPTETARRASTPASSGRAQPRSMALRSPTQISPGIVAAISAISWSSEAFPNPYGSKIAKVQISKQGVIIRP